MEVEGLAPRQIRPADLKEIGTKRGDSSVRWSRRAEAGLPGPAVPTIGDLPTQRVPVPVDTENLEAPVVDVIHLEVAQERLGGRIGRYIAAVDEEVPLRLGRHLLRHSSIGFQR
jgi:hypothetical protein